MASNAELPTPLTVKFEALGRETQNLTSWTIDSNYLVSTDGFSFTYVDKPERFDGLECTPVQLLVRDAPQLVGRIDTTETGEDGLSAQCEGRDYFADLVECHIDPALALTEGMTLQKAVALAVSPCGIKIVLGDASIMRNLRTGTRRGKKAPADFLTLTLQDAKPDPDEGIYEYVNKLGIRHGVTAQPTLARNELLLMKPNYDQEPAAVLRRTTIGTANRIKRGVARRDFSRFPTFTIVRAQNAGSAANEKSPKNASALSDTAGLTPETARVSVRGRVKPSPGAPDANGKLYRLLTLHDERATTRAQVESTKLRAIWDRLKDTLTYRATLKGHADPDTGAIYSIDTIVDVQDDVARVHERMWVYKRTLRYDPKNGAETDIECWRIGAYQLGMSA